MKTNAPLILFTGVILGAILTAIYFHNTRPTPASTDSYIHISSNKFSTGITLSNKTFHTESNGAATLDNSRLSQKDTDLIAEYGRRQLSGEYILLYESPYERKRVNAVISQSAALWAFENHSNLFALLNSYGLPQKIACQIETHLMKIHQAASETEAAMIQLLTAKQDFDKNILSILSSDNYENFRLYFNKYSARRDIILVQQYATNNNIIIDINNISNVCILINNSIYYTEEHWNGPYDPIPSPLVGRKEVLKRTQERLEKLTRQAEWAHDNMSKYGVSSANSNLLHAFYVSKIDNMKRFIKEHTNPNKKKIMAEYFKNNVLTNATPHNN